MKNEAELLALWKARFAAASSSNKRYSDKIDEYIRQYNGEDEKDRSAGRQLVRNFTYELIESQLDSTLPMPKISTASTSPVKRRNAKTIEAMLKSFIARLSLDTLNGEEERLTKIAGTTFRLLGWDNSSVSHTFCGEPFLRLIDPRQVICQPDVADIKFMDYIFICFDDTVGRLSERYSVHIDGVSEDSDEVVTQISVYYKNGKGGIGLFSWASQTVLENDDSYCTRKTEYCTVCGKERLFGSEKCECGSKRFRVEKKEYEELFSDIVLSDGETVIPCMTNGKRTRIAYYTPKVFPVMVRKNVAVYGKLSGESDCGKIRDLQLAHNVLAKKVQQKILKGGSVLTLPRGVRIETSDREDKLVYLDTPVQKTLIDAISLQPSVQQDLQLLDKYYEDARSTLGITDSYQGKTDATAISGIAKQFAATQSASRIEHKKKLKNASYIELYKAIFQYMLAFADEPRSYALAEDGEISEAVFRRYDFLAVDENGDLYYDDDYIFEIDSSAVSLTDRQSLWTEARANFTSGAFGSPSSPQAVLMLWRQLEALGYPSAGAVRKQLEESPPIEPIG